MSIVLNITVFLTLTAASILLLLPAIVLFGEICFAKPITTKPHHINRSCRPRLAIIIPAHNESQVIAETLKTIMSQQKPNDLVLVVADNCSDDTAKIANSMGANVTSRHDDLRRGKGYALDHGVRALRLVEVPPEIVIVIDADCRLGEKCLDILATLCAVTGRPIQADDRMELPRLRRGIYAKLSSFAWVVKNYVRPLGGRHLGIPCTLFGTGMALPWHLISEMDLASGNITEDLKLTIDLAINDRFVLFCPDAQVVSKFPENVEAAKTQRRRWEHGYINNVTKQLPKLIAATIKRRSIKLAALTLDLCVPPLSLLVLMISVCFWLSMLLYALKDIAAPLFISGMALLLIGAGMLIAWKRYGQGILELHELIMVPLYVAGKVATYGKYFINREAKWIRTSRDIN